MFKVRWLEDSDYATLCKWWKDWRWTAPPKELLPDNGKCGLMVSDENGNICAGFLYLTNSKFAMVEYIISDFNRKDKKIRKHAMKALIHSLVTVAKKHEYKALFTSVKDENLKKSYLESGFEIGSESTTEMIKII